MSTTRKWFFIDPSAAWLHRVDRRGTFRTRCGLKVIPGYSVLTEELPKLSARDASRLRCKSCKRAMAGRFE